MAALEQIKTNIVANPILIPFKAEEVVENDEPEVVEEVVEVVEVEAPVKDKTVDKDGKKKLLHSADTV